MTENGDKYTGIRELATARAVFPHAKAFLPVKRTDGQDDKGILGWTFAVRRGPLPRYSWVTLDGVVFEDTTYTRGEADDLCRVHVRAAGHES